MNEATDIERPETRRPLEPLVSQLFFSRDGVTIYNGDCRDVLKKLPDCSVNCCVTSPPYFGLRDYGHEGQIGLEKTPEAYVARMVAVFREVRRVLREDGTLWLNLGDSYCSTDKWGGGKSGNTGKQTVAENGEVPSWAVRAKKDAIPGIKPKDLVGIPWRVAFALQADGWWLRQDIIWHKPNPMPESVTDRCTKSHEYLFLLSKGPRYHFDHEAIKEAAVGGQSGAATMFKQEGSKREQTIPGQSYGTHRPDREAVSYDADTRNKRSVWTVATRPFAGAHFATFPPQLIEPCIRAGCPDGGTVLDPFLGSGTTAEVGQRLGCRVVGIELNEEYAELASSRFRQSVLFHAG